MKYVCLLFSNYLTFCFNLVIWDRLIAELKYRPVSVWFFCFCLCHKYIYVNICFEVITISLWINDTSMRSFFLVNTDQTNQSQVSTKLFFMSCIHLFFFLKICCSLADVNYFKTKKFQDRNIDLKWLSIPFFYILTWRIAYQLMPGLVKNQMEAAYISYKFPHT